MSNDDLENKIYFSKYKPEKKIGEGSFGKIYSAINIYTNEKFALKLVIIIIIIKLFSTNLYQEISHLYINNFNKIKKLKGTQI